MAQKENDTGKQMWNEGTMGKDPLAIKGTGSFGQSRVSLQYCSTDHQPRIETQEGKYKWSLGEFNKDLCDT